VDEINPSGTNDRDRVSGAFVYVPCVQYVLKDVTNLFSSLST